MSFSFDQYSQLRPFLYHVTARGNLERLRRTRRLDPAAHLMERAGQTDLIRSRRREETVITVDREPVFLKDQRPLIEANVALTPPWEFGDFVQYLNEHVYFWPGDALSPVVSGRRLLAHYAEELPLVLRIPARSLVESNPEVEPLFSPVNSGAPRMQRGKPVERGPDLFRPSDRCRRRAHEVIEVAFRGSVVLSKDATIAVAPEEWLPLTVAT